jgi:hypothetical protein
MGSDPLYSSATSALLIAMTALQCAGGVAPDVALDNARQVWNDHVDRRGSGSFEYPDLQRIVAQLTR